MILLFRFQGVTATFFSVREEEFKTSRGKTWSKAAVASLILGILGFATLWLVVGLFLAAAGAVCGHMAQHHISKSPRKIRGGGMAGFGLAICYFSMLLFPVLAIGVGASLPLVKNFRAEQVEKRKEESQMKASRLFVACEAYARANKGKFPDNWESLSGRYVPARELDKLLQSPHPGGEKIAFELVPHERPVLAALLDSQVVIQEMAPPQIPEVASVTADGNVTMILNPNRN